MTGGVFWPVLKTSQGGGRVGLSPFHQSRRDHSQAPVLGATKIMIVPVIQGVLDLFRRMVGLTVC